MFAARRGRQTAMIRSSWARLAREHGQRGWTNITRLARVGSAMTVVPTGQVCGQIPARPGVAAYPCKKPKPAARAITQVTVLTIRIFGLCFDTSKVDSLGKTWDWNHGKEY
jgi:hypothetical protein